METGTGPAVDLGDAISVELQKTSAGLGFSLDGGKASVHGDRPLYIKRIFKGTLLCQNRNSTLNDGKEEVYFVVLTKEEGSGLGFGIAGGVDLEQKCVTVHRVFSRGIAGLEGTIQRGDNIISISGTPLGGYSHGDALSVLHQARLPKQALVVIRRGKESEPLSPRQEVPASGGRQSQSTRDVTMETGTVATISILSSFRVV
ncbi:PDZ domain-containing protein 2 [Acipenser ruthenus]|uniref:PDZ domain-containing protein 2 n=1 Tax=Acipenser ruthenus TaxID=7906 RepID=A0A444U284_ACIRT|nr:PDZ domain-containing protein 2 [Acipenser ruthenus]